MSKNNKIKLANKKKLKKVTQVKPKINMILKLISFVPTINFTKLSKFFVWLILIAIVISLTLPPLISVFGQTKNYSIDQLDVAMKVNKDSTINISEKITYTFDDEMNGMFREIALSNQNNLDKCRSNSSLQCGGFDEVVILGVKVNDQNIDKSRYGTRIVSVDSEERLRIEYKFDNAPVYLNNQNYTFQIDYLIYGGLGFFQDYELFYWNAIFPDRDKPIRQTNISINYPNIVSTNTENLQILGTSSFEYSQEIQTNDGNSITNFSTTNLAPNQNFTILQKIPKGTIIPPAKITFDLYPQTQTLKIPEKNLEIEIRDGQKISLPIDQALTAQFDGGFMYEPKIETFSLKEGQETTIKSHLELTTIGLIITILTILANILFLILAIIVPILIWKHWYKHGRDPKVNSTIIPEYSPPKEVKAYMAGLVMDENVDNRDISSIIIDLAYKGYLSIEELKKDWFGSQDYLFSKNGEEKTKKSQLDATEERVMKMIFDTNKTKRKLSELKDITYKKLENIKNQIYKQCVEEGYFVKNPQKTRTKWLVAGITFLVIGIGIGIFLFFIYIFTTILAVVSIGVSIIIFSRFMPAKTIKGGETLMHLKGFEMYMQTAENDRMQNLTPEMFEEYLPFAIIFGLEKQWATKFKDIAKANPEWYHSQNNNFDTLIFASALSNFTTNTNSTISTNSSGSGSGFGSGGGFSGGFSGGGGGGGGGGAW